MLKLFLRLFPQLLLDFSHFSGKTLVLWTAACQSNSTDKANADIAAHLSNTHVKGTEGEQDNNL